MKYVWGILLVIFCCSNAVGQESEKSKPAWFIPDFDSLYKGTLYPAMKLETMPGNILTNDALQGKVVFICCWFESCPGCRAEFAEVNELYDSLKNNKDFMFLGLTYDDIISLKNFIPQYDLKFPVVTCGNQTEFRRLNFGMGCPGIIILNKSGRIAYIGMKTLVRINAQGEYQLSVKDAVAMVRELK